MPVPTLVTDLSTTLASNSPSGSDNVFPDLDNYLRAISAFIASIRDNSGNGWVSPYLPLAGGTVTGATTFSSTVALNGALSGTGLTTYLASPPAIGGTTPNTGAFTTLAASSDLTLSGGTANGVLYLNGSKVATSGSALTFDGNQTLSVGTTGGNITAAGTSGITTLVASTTSNNLQVQSRPDISYSRLISSSYLLDIATVANQPILFTVNGSEQMRLTSTGLGIGTSSPATRLDVQAGATSDAVSIRSTLNTNGAAVAGIAQFGGNSLGTSVAYSGIYGNIDSNTAGSHGGGMRFFTATSGSFTEKMRLDSSGNLGLGVTPSAWATSNRKVFQIGVGGSGNVHFAGSATGTVLSSNYYFNGTNSIYINSNFAQSYIQGADGSHAWNTAPSGTAGNTISFTQAMTLDAGGQLSVGTTAVTTAGSSYQAFTINGANGSNLALNGGGTNIGLIYAATGNSNLYIGNQTASGAVIFNAGSGTERARITSGGDLLVGTTSTESGVRLWAANSAAAFNWVKSSNSLNAAYIGVRDTGEAQVSSSGAYPFTFYTNGSERARITSGGDFQLGTGGTASANVRSIINGSSTTGYGGYIEFQNDGSAFAAVGDYKALGGGGSTALLICKNSTGGVYLATSGATSWSAVSDENKKNIIENISDAAAKVSSLRAVIGTYKDDPNAERHPFLIAQDVQAVLPEAVTDNEGVLGLSYSDVIPLLVAAIKEQQALITALTARVQALEAQP